MSPAKKKTRKTKKDSARRKPAAPKKPSSTKKAAKKSSVKKKPVKKKMLTKKTPAKKAPAAAKAKPPVLAPGKKEASKGARPKKKTSKPGKVPSVLPPDAHPKLGIKHTCYECGAKFYDLFRPEPLCPKCGADQREAPKVEARVKPIAKPKRTRKAMAPLLDDDEDEAAFDEDDVPDRTLGPAGAAFDDPADITEEETEG